MKSAFNLDLNVRTGKRLRECRESAGIMQKYLANCIGITPQHLHNIEKGKRTLTTSLANKIGEILSVDSAYLLCKTSEPHSGQKFTLVERQVIVTWTRPDDRMPEPCVFVVVTVSAKLFRLTYDHALVIADWDDKEGWWFEDSLLNQHQDLVTVHAWADLEPYKGN